jgi:hypothetical protein
MSNYDFSKFDKQVDIAGLKNDIQEAAENGGGDFKEVPLGTYEVKIKKLELKASKKGDPMVSCWMQILDGAYKGSMLFMNQVITRGFQVHIVNEFLRALDSGLAISFESYSQYGALLMDIAEAIDGKREYALEYGEKNGFNTFKITEVFEPANA